MKEIILLTGPGGSGKSTIAKQLCEQHGYIHLDGDHEDTEFFPQGGQWLVENSEQLKKAHIKIVNKAAELVKNGAKVVIDYIIFGNYAEFVTLFRDRFGDAGQILILLPSIETTIQRDKDRECWTTGEKRIQEVFSEFKNIQTIIGAEKYIDTSEMSIDETVEAVLARSVLSN